MCFKKKVNLLVSDLYVYQNARCKNKNCLKEFHEQLQLFITEW